LIELTSGERDPLSPVDEDNLLSEEVDADSGEKDANSSKMKTTSCSAMSCAP